MNFEGIYTRNNHFSLRKVVRIKCHLNSDHSFPPINRVTIYLNTTLLELHSSLFFTIIHLHNNIYDNKLVRSSFTYYSNTRLIN
jgi:hypothetical protein